MKKTLNNIDARALAEYLFGRGMSQKDIAVKVGVAESTISDWSRKGKWREKRAAVSISRKEIVNKLLLQLHDAITKDGIAALNDNAVNRMYKMIKGLDKEYTVVDYIDVFMEFGGWLPQHPEYASEIEEVLGGSGTPWERFARAVNIAQDKMVNTMITMR